MKIHEATRTLASLEYLCDEEVADLIMAAYHDQDDEASLQAIVDYALVWNTEMYQHYVLLISDDYIRE